MKHSPEWEYKNDRASGSLVMWITRTCKICGYKEETFRTPYDGIFNKAKWIKIECLMTPN